LKNSVNDPLGLHRRISGRVRQQGWSLSAREVERLRQDIDFHGLPGPAADPVTNLRFQAANYEGCRDTLPSLPQSSSAPSDTSSAMAHGGGQGLIYVQAARPRQAPPDSAPPRTGICGSPDENHDFEHVPDIGVCLDYPHTLGL
jgi:hypothetical protein